MMTNVRAVENGLKYINGMLNACYMTGIVSDVDMQNRSYKLLLVDPSSPLAVTVRYATGVIPPRRGSFLTVFAHVEGVANAVEVNITIGNQVRQLKQYQRSIVFRQIRLLDTGVGVLANPLVPYLAARMHMDGIANPVRPNGGLRKEALEEFKKKHENDQIVQDFIKIYEETYSESNYSGAASRYIKKTNHVEIAGFIDEVEYEEPSAQAPSGILHITVRQQKDATRAIPVMMTGQYVKALGGKIAPGTPVRCIGLAQNRVTGTGETLQVVRAVNLSGITQRDIYRIPDWAKEYFGDDEEAPQLPQQEQAQQEAS